MMNSKIQQMVVEEKSIIREATLETILPPADNETIKVNSEPKSQESISDKQHDFRFGM